MKDESPREIAERIAGFSLVAFHSNVDAVRAQIAADIEAALNAERERAAKIAEQEAGTRCMKHQKTGKGVCGYEIAAIIRGSKSGAE